MIEYIIFCIKDYFKIIAWILNRNIMLIDSREEPEHKLMT